MNRLAVLAAALVLSSGCSQLISVADHPAVRSGRGAGPVLYWWQNVLDLKRGAKIAVGSRDGEWLQGAVIQTDVSGILLRVDAAERRIERSDVRQVDLLSPPGSTARAIGRGVVRGSSAAVLATAFWIALFGGNPLGLPAEAAARIATAGGVVGASAELSARRGRTVYFAPNP